jgi:hypothetical protein
MFQPYKVEADRPHTACNGSYAHTTAKFDAKSSYNDVFFILASFIRLLISKDPSVVLLKNCQQDLVNVLQEKITFISMVDIANGIDSLFKDDSFLFLKIIKIKISFYCSLDDKIWIFMIFFIKFIHPFSEDVDWNNEILFSILRVND